MCDQYSTLHYTYPELKARKDREPFISRLAKKQLTLGGFGEHNFFSGLENHLERVRKKHWQQQFKQHLGHFFKPTIEIQYKTSNCVREK